VSRALFWVHDAAAPSFRHRLAAHVPALEAAGIRCDVEEFPRRRYGLRVLERAARLAEFDLLVIAKFKLETGERWVVRRRARRIAYDFDDAIYFGKPDRPGAPPDRSARRVRKFEATCAMSDLVTAGNATLASAARRTGRRVEIVPTGIDLRGYRPSSTRETTGRVVYRRLAERRAGTRLVVVSERAPASFAAPFELVAWSKGTEAAALSACDVGIMPLDDDEWTRGKGGFKLLQYMAAGLPTVASPVGVNTEITVDGETGFLASSPEEWESRIERLLADPELRQRMGSAGRRRVEGRYAMPLVSRQVVELYGGLIESEA